MGGILPDDLADPIAQAERALRARREQESERRQSEAAERAAAKERETIDALEYILGDALRAEMADAYAESTRRVYRSDVKRFKKWCIEEAVPYLPASPPDVAAFLLDMAGGGETMPPWRALVRMRTAIGYLHQVGQFANPCDDIWVRATMRWLRSRYNEMKAAQETN
jgi:hypothetical protein